MTIAEPMTMFTDYLLAGWTAWLAWKLLSQSEAGKAVRWWGRAFICSAAAAFFGGSYHGLAPMLPPELLWFLWKITVYAIGLAGLFLLIGTALSTLSGAARRWLIRLALLKFALYAVWMFGHDSFFYVVLDYLPSLIIVLLLFSWRLFRYREYSGAWVAAGILISFAAAGVQQSGVSMHRHFNHNDLYHLIQMLGFYFLYRGARLLPR